MVPFLFTSTNVTMGTNFPALLGCLLMMCRWPPPHLITIVNLKITTASVALTLARRLFLAHLLEPPSATTHCGFGIGVNNTIEVLYRFGDCRKLLCKRLARQRMVLLDISTYDVIKQHTISHIYHTLTSDTSSEAAVSSTNAAEARNCSFIGDELFSVWLTI